MKTESLGRDGCMEQEQVQSDSVSFQKILCRKQGYQRIKRLQDVLLSLFALIILSPILLLISVLIVIDDPGTGPIFSQKRCGKNGKEFTFYKFRTMRAGAEQELEQLLRYNEMQGPAFKIKNDPRLTRLGKLLRRTSLDELPQLVNILRGDMTIVGPRPPLPREVEQYTAYQRRRLCVTPGLTCLWQIHPGRYDLSFDEWMALDLQYIRKQSWLLDWKIVLGTVRCVLRGNGE